MKHPLWLRLLSPVLAGLTLLSDLTGCTLPCKHSAAAPETLRPTCTESGYERTVCTDCHEVLAEKILPPLGHTPVWHTDLVADCFHQGRLQAICSECGAIVEESFTEPAAHTWTNTDRTGILRCADCGVIRSEGFENELPVFLISTAQELTQNKEYVDCTVSLVNTAQEHAFLDSSAKIRVRGNNTATQENKLPYKLKFDKKVQLLGLGGGKAKQWVLLAELFDPTSLRNYFSLSMGRKLEHIGFCSDCTFAEVYIDGVYKGVYLVAEQNEIGTHRVNIKETEEADTPFYIVCDNADVENGTAGADCFEIMTPEQYPVYFVVKNQNATPLQVQTIKEYMENAYRLVIEGTREEIEAAFDIPSFVDSTILQMFVLDPDTVMRSFYYVKGADGKLACTSPWDFDLAYGNFAGFEDWTDVVSPNYTLNALPHLLYSRRDWFYQMVKDRYAQLRADGVFEELYGDLMYVAQDVAPYLDREDALMGTISNLQEVAHTSVISPAAYEYKTFWEAMAGLKEWILQRLLTLDRTWIY